MKRTKGFTIIELSIVVAIIVLLTTLGLVSFDIARVKSRNAQRSSDLAKLQIALEQYFADNREYPLCTGGTLNQYCSSYYPNPYPSQSGNLKNLPITGYLPHIPSDPLNTGSASGHDYFYVRGYQKTSNTTFYRTDLNSDYVLMARFENAVGTKALETFTGRATNESSTLKQLRTILLGSSDF